MNKINYEIESFVDSSYPVETSMPDKINEVGLMVAPHIHSRMELMKVIKGPVSVTVGINHYLCYDGDIIFVPPNTLHEVSAECSNKLLKGIIFVYEPFNFNFTDYRYDILLDNSKIQNHIITRDSNYYKDMDVSFNNIYNTHKNKSDTLNLEESAYILLLLATLIKIYAPDFKKNLDNQYLRLQPVLDYINKHYREKIYISSLSNILNLCDDYFIKLFKSTMKQSPAQYITNIRIHQAMILLSSTKLSIADIAEKTGFASYEHFCRTFKQRNNVTPYSYRKKVCG